MVLKPHLFSRLCLSMNVAHSAPLHAKLASKSAVGSKALA